MAVYYVYSGAVGSGTGASWANAFTTLTLAFSGKAAGDVFYVAHDHAESTAAAITLTTAGAVANPSKVICVNRAGSVPPVSADRRATATVSTTGGSAINFVNSFVHYDGIIFNVGSAGNIANCFLPQSGNTWYRFDNCSLRLTTATASLMVLGNGVAGVYLEFNNTTFSFGAAGQFLDVSCVMRWRNTPSALPGAAIPNQLFKLSGKGTDVECIGVDFSAAGGTCTLAIINSGQTGCRYKFLDCKLHASVIKELLPDRYGAGTIDFLRSGASGNYLVHSARYSGTLDQETTIVRTGGATDGTTPLSWKIVTTANISYSLPFDCPPIAIWNDTTGSAVTATVEGIWGGGAVPLDNDIWLEVEYLGSSSSPQGSFVNDGSPDLLTTAANQTSSSETWGGSTTKFKLNVTFTPQQKGWIYARIKCAKASSTFYIDPLVVLS